MANNYGNLCQRVTAFAEKNCSSSVPDNKKFNDEDLIMLNKFTDNLTTIRTEIDNQNINYYYTLNDTNIFAFEAQHLLQDEDPFYNAVIEDKTSYATTADALGLNGTQIGYDIAQNRRIKSNQLDAKLDYYNILNAKSNINLTLGTILSRQDFNSNIFQFLDDGSIFNPTPTFNNGRASNDIQYNFSDVYLGLHYTLKAGKFTFRPGFSTHSYGNKNSQFGEEYKDDKIKYSYPITQPIIRIPQILPGDFVLKILEDENENGIWDTGVYGKIKKQPEKINLTGTSISIKADWENEFNIILKK